MSVVKIMPKAGLYLKPFETTKILSTYLSCHNFFSLSSVQIILYQLVAYCVCFKMIYKKSI